MLNKFIQLKLPNYQVMFFPERHVCRNLWVCSAHELGYGTTELGYGTTNTDAGVGIGMLKGGFRNLTKKGYDLADKAIN